MLLSVRHETTYAYEGVASQVTQTLRLTPRDHDAQAVLDWRITRSDGAPIAAYVDGLGNACSFSSRQDPGDKVVIRVAGRVRTQDAGGLVNGAVEPLPPGFFLKATPLTIAAEAVRGLASTAMKGAGVRKGLERLMAAVGQKIAYAPVHGAYVETPAEAALAAGSGSAPDLAHVMIAAARAAGVPARYVGGYVWRGASGADAPFASHAWTEVWIDNVGWIGLDPSLQTPVTESHIRVAAGLDYRQAGPISGFWRGAGAETMRVDGAVTALESEQ
jgi:transglutaminase-like putative cysteine protease